MQLKPHKATQISETPEKKGSTKLIYPKSSALRSNPLAHDPLSGICSRGEPGSLSLQGILVSTSWVPGATTTI